MLSGCFFVAMFVNGAVLAGVVARSDEPAATPAVASKSKVVAEAPRLSRKAVVQRRVLLALVRSPSRLPRRFVDQLTGLPKRNLRVSCRHLRWDRYVCHVRVPGNADRLRVYVRYKRGSGPVQFGREVLRNPV